MVFVDEISDLEYYHVNSDWGCYGDIVTEPRDIMLQAQLGTLLPDTTHYQIYICGPDGTIHETSTAYFDVCFHSMYIGGINYFFANIRCNRYSPEMLSRKCFVIKLVFYNYYMGVTTFNKYTQKYQLLNNATYPDDVVVVYSGSTRNISELCSVPVPFGSCNPLIKIVSQFDCLDSYTGDFYGTGYFIAGSSGITEVFPFVRFSWIEGMIKRLPTSIKRTISINCRTQRTEQTKKYVLSGFKPFPLWKMEEIEGMLLANRFFAGEKQYQSEGGTPFSQFGQPKNCVYVYKLEMELQDCYQWQTFGCTPPCTPVIFYYPIAF